MDYYALPDLRELAFVLPPLLWFRERALRVMEAHLPRKARRILDVGCGTGFTTRRLARRFPRAEVLGLDLSPAMIARAKRVLLPNLRYAVGDVRTLEGRFDLVVGFYVWMLLPEGDLGVLRNLLVPEGRALLVLTAPTLFTRFHRVFYRRLGGGEILLERPSWWRERAAKEGFFSRVVPIHSLEGSFLLQLALPENGG